MTRQMMYAVYSQWSLNLECIIMIWTWFDGCITHSLFKKKIICKWCYNPGLTITINFESSHLWSTNVVVLITISQFNLLLCWKCLLVLCQFKYQQYKFFPTSLEHVIDIHKKFQIVCTSKQDFLLFFAILPQRVQQYTNKKKNANSPLMWHVTKFPSKIFL